jgi:hypothetical protein
MEWPEAVGGGSVGSTVLHDRKGARAVDLGQPSHIIQDWTGKTVA